jgi:hypothetical protein
MGRPPSWRSRAPGRIEAMLSVLADQPGQTNLYAMGTDAGQSPGRNCPAASAAVPARAFV